MIVEEIRQSKGEIIKNKSNGNIFLSYCPQTDNFDTHMTPEETLVYLCQIYGYDMNSTKIVSLSCHIDC